MDDITKNMLTLYWSNKLPSSWKVLKIRNIVPGTYYFKVKVKGEEWNNHVSLSRYSKTNDQTRQVVAGTCSTTRVLVIGPEFEVEEKKPLTDKDINQFRHRSRQEI